MNGALWLESREGAGSTFFFNISVSPWQCPANFPCGGSTGGTAAAGRALHPGRRGQPSLTSASSSILLEARGHHPTIAGDGAAALERGAPPRTT